MTSYESAENFRLGKTDSINAKKALESYREALDTKDKNAAEVQIAMLNEFKDCFASVGLWDAIFKLMLFRRRVAELGIDDVPYNLTLETDSFDNIKKLSDCTFRVAKSVLQKNPRVVICAEDNMLSTESFLEQAKNTDIMFIVGLTDFFFENIDRYSRLFRQTPGTTKILCLTSTQLNRLRKDYEAFHFRVVGHESANHVSLCNYSEDDVFFALMTALSAQFEISPKFADGIKRYLSFVYPRADLKSQAFTEDLYNRVTRQHINSAVNNNVISTEAVPFYKEKEQEKTEDTPSDNSTETPIYTQENVPTDGHKVNLLKKDENKQVNVLLLSLSTMGWMIKNDFSLKGEEDGQKYSGIYQLDPIPKMLSAKLAEQGQYLDKVVMLETAKTKEKWTKPIFVYEKNDKRELYQFSGSAADFFKAQIIEYLRPLSENETYSDRFLEFDFEEHNYDEGIRTAVNRIREIKKAASEENKEINLYVDIHGGLRSGALAFEAVLSLLDREGIKPEKVYSIEDSDKKIFEDDSHRLFSFVSGINEFRSFGRIDSLKEYLSSDKPENNHPLIEAIEKISDAISFCDTKKLEEGIKDLRKYYRGNDRKETPPLPYLAIFEDNIKGEFGSLITNENITVVDEIEWCLKRRLYQPALTLLECRMPYYLFGGLDSDGQSGIIKISKENRKYIFDSEKQKAERNKKPFYAGNNSYEFASECIYSCLNCPNNIELKRNKLNVFEDLYKYIPQDKKTKFEGSVEKYLIISSSDLSDIALVVKNLLCIHGTLKKERNNYNHMLEDKKRLNKKYLEQALSTYIETVRLLENNLKK